jgi:gliding motility-associated-like protein
MPKNKLLSFLAFLFLLLFYHNAKSQTNNIGIVLNEISVGNTGYPDNYGLHDAVEIYNPNSFSVSLQSYYLSNDRNNLYKWKFPTTFTLAPNGYQMVFLSGINESKQQGGTWYYHANFTLDQCKKQWLILSTNTGVVRDSVVIQQTMKGHTWGRIDVNQMGIQAWRLYTTHSFPLPNPIAGSYKGYMPMPRFKPAAGWGHNAADLGILVNGFDADSSFSCNEVHYTMNGSYPTLADPVYTGTNNPIIITDNSIFRAVNFQKQASATYTPLGICLLDSYHPSFCETNTYFSESSGSYDDFHPEFGVLSVAIHTVDTNFFNTNGALTRTVHVEYFDKKQQVLEGYADMARPFQEAWMTKQKGFYLTIDDARGYGCNFEGNIFNVAGLGTTSRTVFPTLHVKGGDIESHSPVGTASAAVSNGTGLRDVFLQTLAIKHDLKVNPLHVKPIVLFINGKYAGAFNLMEVYDKYYEDYYNSYNNSIRDSANLQNFHGNVDGWIYNYLDGSSTPANNDFRTNVYDWVMTKPSNNLNYYNTLMNKHLDRESFTDYMILNSYALNSHLYTHNIGFARGGNKTNQSTWHYYLWNAPATFTFNAVKLNSVDLSYPAASPCFVHTTVATPSTYGGNGHGNILSVLMGTFPGKQSWGSSIFQLQYKNRYQDLLNTALKCENVLAHFDYLKSLYKKEMEYHEDPGSTPFPPPFATEIGMWDTNMVRFRRVIEERCAYYDPFFNKVGCYNMMGPHDLKVSVKPDNAGTVKLNSIVLPFYDWNGRYFNTQLSFKANPSGPNYVFHHWEFKSHPIKNADPASRDSVAIDFNKAEEVIAVFTDVTADVDLPTGFTPNGDGRNDEFKPLGSALYTSEYDFRIWNRWGQEVFRSTEPSYGWDGTYQGQPAQTGVYAYVITYKNVFGEAKIKKGNVTLVR